MQNLSTPKHYTPGGVGGSSVVDTSTNSRDCATTKTGYSLSEWTCSLKNGQL